MRKLNYLLGLGSLMITMFVTSCTPAEDAIGPTLEITSGEAVTVAANSTIVIKWRASAGDANMSSFTIKQGNTTIVDEFGNDWNALSIPSAKNETYIDSAKVIIGTEDVSFTLVATDKDDLTDSKTVTVTVETEALPLQTQGTFELGAAGNAKGSYYSVSEATVYTSSVAKVNASKVDMVFNSTASAAILTAPKNANLTEVKNTGKITTFEIVNLDFDTMTAVDVDGVTPTADEITVEEGDVVVFKTNDNTKGVLKISGLTVATDGQTSITVKVKQ